jgi:site-specific DNA-methyltransferase (adenine-specific)
MKINLFNDDCLNVLKTMKDNSIDSCVTDPPYGLSFMGKSWDYDVPKVEIWKEVYRVLKPGAYLLAFFGSRTYHRGVVQIEDAGFEIRDQIMWLYGSGFPKSHNIGKAIDKEAGAQRKVIGNNKNFGVTRKEDGKNSFGDYKGEWELTEPATEAAKQWDGWGTALKPAHEPIVVARKPISQTVAKNVLEYGTGAINIDECRVPTNDKLGDGMGVRKTRHGGWDRPWMHDSEVIEKKKKESAEKVAIAEELGRWPANVIHDGSDEVVSKFPNSKLGKSNGNDSDSASRFFYCAKASKSDRESNNNHPTVKPTDLMKYLCRLVTPPNGIVLDPFMGSGSTGKAALQEGFKFVGIEMNKEYYEIAQNRLSSLDNFFE